MAKDKKKAESAKEEKSLQRRGGEAIQKILALYEADPTPEGMRHALDANKTGDVLTDRVVFDGVKYFLATTNRVMPVEAEVQEAALPLSDLPYDISEISQKALLQRALDKADKTPKELADALGESEEIIAQWLKHEAVIHADKMKDIAAFLQMEPGEKNLLGMAVESLSKSKEAQRRVEIVTDPEAIRRALENTVDGAHATDDLKQPEIRPRSEAESGNASRSRG